MAEGMNVGTIYYEVESDTAQLVNSTVAVDGSLDHLQQTMRKTDGAAAKLETKMDKVAAAAKNFGREANTANSSVSGLLKLMGGLLTLQGANTLIQMAEAYGEMAERVRMATGSQEEYEMVQQRLLATANGTYRSLAEAQEVYIRTADSLRSMGYSTAQVLDITDSMSYAFVKNATSTDRANSAIDAYTKSINKGKVESDSWESIIAAIPTVINDIAQASGKSSSEIREMGASGKITAQMLNEGLRQSFESNKKAADDMATTVKDAFTAMRNSLSAYLGEANMATGSTGMLSKSIILLADNIDVVVKLLTTAGAGALAAYIGSMGMMALASLKSVRNAQQLAATTLAEAQAHRVATAAALTQAQTLAAVSGMQNGARIAADAHAAAELRLAAAQRAVAASSLTLTGLLGGPVGIIALVATAAAGFYLFRDSSKDTKLELAALHEVVSELGTELLKVRRTQFEDKSEELKKTAEQLRRNVEWTVRYQEQNAKYAQDKRFQDRLQVERAELEKTRDDLEKYGKKVAEIDAELGKRSGAVPNEAPKAQADPDVANRLAAMREELALTKLQGEARVRLQAIQKLGEKATEGEKQEAAGLAEQIYRIEQARDALTKKTQEEKAAEEQNLRVIYDLNEALLLAGKSGEDLAVAKALIKLNPAATPDEIARVEELARALNKVQEAEANRTLLGQMDPFAGEQQRFEQQLANLRTLKEAYDKHTNQKLLSDQRYLELKTAAEQQHAAAMAALEEERFRQQSVGNELLMATLDQLKYATTDVFMSMLDGTFQARDAVKALSLTVLREAVGAFVEMGVAQVKAWIVGRAAQTAAGASYAASVAGQVAATTALAAQAAFASTAAIPIVGPAAAPAAAAAAATAAGALGAPAITASAAVVAGGRQYGGDVAAQKMYRINENGRPEIYNAANGQQFLLPGTRGSVEPAASSGPGGINITFQDHVGVSVSTRRLSDGQIIHEINQRVQQGVSAAVATGAAQLATRSGAMYSGLQAGSVVQRRAKPSGKERG